MTDFINPPAADKRRSDLVGLGLTERRVLGEIRSNTRIHRLEIATRCDLQPSTLTRSAAILLDLGLIREEVETKPGRPGKPRQHLSVNPSGAYSVGVGLTAEEVMICVADFGGRVLWQSAQPLIALDPSSVADQIFDFVQLGLNESGVDPERTVGVGITMPGTTSNKPPHYFKPLPQFVGWSQVSPQVLFSRRLNLPVWVQNDAHATAVAEAQFGAGIGRHTFMTIYIAHGFGAGLYCNGQVFAGAHGNAGAIGGIIPRPLPRPSGDDLLQTLALAGKPFNRLQDVELSSETASCIDVWVDRAANQLTQIIRTAGLVLDPECVILTGLLPEPVLRSLAKGVSDLCALEARELPGPEVLISPLIGRGVVVGAAALPFMRQFAPSSSAR